MDTRSLPNVGVLLRQWRQRRRLSQLDLACEAEVSTRHLSCMETGRALPSREMLLRLAEYLEVPLRERNALLIAAGYAPMFPERPLADPSMSAARDAVARLLQAHQPYPALALDRHWTLVMANASVAPLLAGLPEHLLAPPVNVLRLSLHPEGLAPRIVNLRQWRSHLLARLHRQIEVSGDPVLVALLEELRALPQPAGAGTGCAEEDGVFAGIVVPLRLRSEAGLLSFISTTTVFGTPVDLTLAELAMETFFPADAETARALQRLAG
ncbi:helix-turn-helix transcriptional regulator [Aquabacterium sp. A7-Y]|uniref:helix-turn-helix transcriptional regulator n=1 Tax=Aquabacterium sp. A7-Y TaxID=1349605 RepID=UPI00223CF070|nr:helix-turn-helix transcriptional regulator [Aquabacterium sp. A7-Y]MCW7539248.1 helix-turn-helix transcriptional regulator [Aquabacterium sp. A7-Y]